MMSTFFHIFLYNVVPLSLMIAVGAILQRIFKLDIRTLSKLNLYLFAPVMVFVMLYENTFTAAMFGQVMLFFIIYWALLALATEVVVRLRDLQGGMKGAMRNSVMFYNSGNYAIPLNQLVFMNNPFTMSVQLIIMVLMNLLPNTLGVYSANAHRMTFRQTMKTVLSFPAVYVVAIALAAKWSGLVIPQPIYIPLEYISQAFIATALLTLGAQLANMTWKFTFSHVMLSSSLRLLIAPAIGFGVVWALGYSGPLAQALVISCAVPSSLVSVLLAVEFDNEPDFASQTVFWSTLFSVITVTVVIALAKGL